MPQRKQRQNNKINIANQKRGQSVIAERPLFFLFVFGVKIFAAVIPNCKSAFFKRRRFTETEATKL